MSVFDTEELSHYRSLRIGDEKRFRAMAVLAFCLACLPIAVDPMGGGLFLWNLLPISDFPEQLRLVSPALLGLGLLVAVALKKQTRLALGITGLLLTVLFLLTFSKSQLGYQELFSGVLDFVGRQPLVLFLGLVFVATGSDMRNTETVKPLARRHLVGGGVLLLILYVLPQRGQPFFSDILELLGRLDSLESFQLMMTGVVLLIFQTLPLLVGIVAIAVGYSGSRPGLLGMVARFGLSGLVYFLCYRLMVTDTPAMGVLVQMRAGLLLALVVGTTSYGLHAIQVHLLADPHPTKGDGQSPLARDVLLTETLKDAIAQNTLPHSILESRTLVQASPIIRALIVRRLNELSDDLGLPSERALTPSPEDAERMLQILVDGDNDASQTGGLALKIHRRKTTFAAVTAALVLSSVAGLAWHAHEGTPDLAWELRDSTESERKFFSSILPDYVQSVSKRNLEIARKGAASEANQDVREKRTELLAEARDLNPKLARAVEALLEGLQTLDANGRIWDNAIVRFNRRLRRLGFPFFLEAHTRLYTLKSDNPNQKEQIVRFFWAVPHEVVKIQRFVMEEREFAALHARPLGWQGGHSFLGYVRPDEPFALIKLANIESSVKSLSKGLKKRRCGFALKESYTRPRGHSDHLCGGMLLRALEAAGYEEETMADGLIAFQTAATEIHEVKHQWDADDVRIPDDLYRLQPRARDTHLARFAKEVSAYLTELDTDNAVTTLLVLAQLSGWLAQEDIKQNRYRYAAGLIFNTLSETEILGPEAEVDAKKLKAFWKLLHDNEDSLASWVQKRVRAAHKQLLKTDAPTPAKPL